MKEKYSNKKELLKYVYSSFDFKGNYKTDDFYEGIYSLFDAKPDKIKTFEINKSISKSVFNKMLKKEKYLIKVNYIQKESRKILVGMIVYQGEAISIRTMKKERVLLSKNFEKNITLFKMINTELSIIGNKKKIKNKINKYPKFRVVNENRMIISEEPGIMLENLLKVNDKDSKIDISRIEYQNIDRGKRLRVKAYSDQGSVLRKFLKQNFDEGNTKYKITQIIAISFIGNKETTILKVTRLNENQYIFKWKNHNKLSLEISNLYKLSDELDSLLFDAKNDKELLNDLFRHEKLYPYESKNIYNRILTDYENYISVNDNKIKLNYQNIKKSINDILVKSKYEVKYKNFTKKYDFYFPINKTGSKNQKLIRITKDNKIVQHLFLDQEELYEQGNKDTIKKFFIFSPCLMLDFRKTTKNDFDYQAYNDYIINSGEFLYNLKYKNNQIIKIFTEMNKDIIEEFGNKLEDHYAIAIELLDKIDTFKRLTSEQKGKLFETICFIILSKMFITKRLGGSLKPDGKFIVDDEKIVYDAKNIGPKTSFVKSVTRNGKVKDIDYIRKENTDKYVYIVTDIKDKEFKEVQTKINKAIPKCTVSAITIGAIKDLVKYYDYYDPKKFNHKSLMNKISSGKIIRDLPKSDVIMDGL